MNILQADWSAPSHVRAFTTLRSPGASKPPYEGFNVGAHVGDSPESVAENRRQLRSHQSWRREPLWLNQVHGTTVIRVQDKTMAEIPSADGSVTRVVGQPLVIQTADCLPVVACDKKGSVIGAFHAGWRGLAAGILETGLGQMGCAFEDLLVWIGPGIGVESYQVGSEVRQVFVEQDPLQSENFRPDGPDHWHFDLAGAARRRLERSGVTAIFGGNWDTASDERRFFSYRRHNPCGRMATCIVLEKETL